MARDNPKPDFRRIPQHGGYPGLIGLTYGSGTREVVMLGTGAEVEEAVIAKVREIEGG